MAPGRLGSFDVRVCLVIAKVVPIVLGTVLLAGFSTMLASFVVLLVGLLGLFCAIRVGWSSSFVILGLLVFIRVVLFYSQLECAYNGLDFRVQKISRTYLVASRCGVRVKLKGKVQEPRGSDTVCKKVSSASLLRCYEYSRGVVLCGRVFKCGQFGQRSLRDTILAKMFINIKEIDEELAASVMSILYGYGKAPGELYWGFKHLNLLHALAVSGYNIIAFFFVLDLVLRSRRKLYLAIKFFVANLFFWLVGWQAPILRAWVSSLIGVIRAVLGMPSFKGNCFINTVLVVFLIDPSMLFTVSMQLSLLATGLAMFLPALFSRFSKRKFWVFVETALINLVVSLYLYFVAGIRPRISILGIVISPLLLEWLDALIVFGYLLSVLTLIFPKAAWGFVVFAPFFGVIKLLLLVR